MLEPPPKKVAPLRLPPTTASPTMSDCVDTLPLVTRLKLDRMPLAVIASARAGPAAASSTSIDAAPSACMDFVILVCFPQNAPARDGSASAWRRYVNAAVQHQCFCGFSFGNLTVRIR